MKIVVDARMAFMSGIGRYLRNVIRAFYSCKKHDFILLGNPNELTEFTSYPHINAIEVKSGVYNPKEHIELAFKIPKCDIYYAPHFITPLLPIKAKKVISTIHDTFHLVKDNYLNFLKKSYAKLLYKHTVKISDVIITVSNTSKKNIEKYLPKSKNRGKNNAMQ